MDPGYFANAKFRDDGLFVIPAGRVAAEVESIFRILSDVILRMLYSVTLIRSHTPPQTPLAAKTACRPVAPGMSACGASLFLAGVKNYLM